MKNILELQDDLSHLIRSAQDITAKAEKENRVLSEGESKDIDDFMAKAKEVEKEIKALEADEARRKQVKAAAEALTKPQNRTAAPDRLTDEPTEVAATPTISGWRTGKLQAFKGKDAEYNAYKSGQWLRATLFNNFRAQEWCRKNGIDFRAALSEGVNTAGGALVPDVMSQAIIDLREQYGVFRQNSRVLPITSEGITIPRQSGHVTAAFVGEGVAITATDPTFNSVGLTAKKLACLTYLSSELDEDAIVSIVDLLTRDMAWAFALKEDQCGFTGDGTSTYGGITGLTKRILESANTAGAVDCATAGHDTLAEVDNTDLTTLMGKLPAFALPSAKFYCSAVAKALVFDRLKAVAGGNTVQTLEGRPIDTYLGYPIVVSQVLPTSTGDLNNLPMLFFGDLRMASTMAERRGIAIKRDDSIKFVEDQIALKATERIDINIHDLGDTSTAGPVVGLIGFTS